MINNCIFAAIIPARKGSKRLPGKNIINFGGKPLIQWTIEAAKKSSSLDHIIITTDDETVLEIGQSFGVETIKRPSQLASDTASSIDVIIHSLEKTSIRPDFVVLLQPTSPLRSSHHIESAIAFLLEKKADAVISVSPVDHHPFWSNELPSDLSMENFLREDVKGKISQDFPAYFRLNGAIYICKTERLLKEKSFFINSNLFGFIMDKQSSVDIDDEFDLNFAEFLLPDTSRD